MLSPKVRIEEDRGIRVLSARGEFVGGKETDLLRETLASEAEAGTSRLLIDLENVQYLNSTALGVLIAAHTNFSRRGGVLALCNVSEGINNIFVITKLSKVFSVHTDRDEAVRELTAAAAAGDDTTAE